MQNELKHHLRVEPYPYQREGIIYGLEKKRLIIGDEPSLGKTLQGIGIVDTADAYPCLVICPSSLKINRQREFEKFTDKSAIVLNNAVCTTWPYLLSMGMHHVAVVNYESLRKYFVRDINGKGECLFGIDRASRERNAEYFIIVEGAPAPQPKISYLSTYKQHQVNGSHRR